MYNKFKLFLFCWACSRITVNNFHIGLELIYTVCCLCIVLPLYVTFSFQAWVHYGKQIKHKKVLSDVNQ